MRHLPPMFSFGLQLLRHYDVADRPIAEPSLIGAAVEEFLRPPTPLHFASRRTVDPIAFRGKTIPANKALFPLIGAANRDPLQFTDPNVLDIFNDPTLHDTFRSPPCPHSCLGNNLARMEEANRIQENPRQVSGPASGWRRATNYQRRTPCPE